MKTSDFPGAELLNFILRYIFTDIRRHENTNRGNRHGGPTRAGVIGKDNSFFPSHTLFLECRMGGGRLSRITVSWRDGADHASTHVNEKNVKQEFERK